MGISFLHTAQVHVETFDGIFDALAPDMTLNHVVVPELLARAQAHGGGRCARRNNTLVGSHVR